MPNHTTPTWHQDLQSIHALAPRSILFLCVANSARSQMAEAIARHLAPPDVAIYSAGSIPTTPHPLALQTLASRAIDARQQHSKSVEDLFGTTIDVVITLCHDEVCPVWLGDAAHFHWSLPDPAAGPVQEQRASFESVCDELMVRLSALFSG